jgi:hypothetical protein
MRQSFFLCGSMWFLEWIMCCREGESMPSGKPQVCLQARTSLFWHLFWHNIPRQFQWTKKFLNVPLCESQRFWEWAHKTTEDESSRNVCVHIPMLSDRSSETKPVHRYLDNTITVLASFLCIWQDKSQIADTLALKPK